MSITGKSRKERKDVIAQKKKLLMNRYMKKLLIKKVVMILIDNIPSDLTIDHHPDRECQYFLNLEEASDDEVFEEDKWLINNLSFTSQCRLVKENTLKLNKEPGSLSDIRLL